MEDESVGVGIFPGHRSRFQVFQGFFVEDILAVGMSLVLDKNFYGKHRCSCSKDGQESIAFRKRSAMKAP
jgi:hypothetical protein